MVHKADKRIMNAPLTHSSEIVKFLLRRRSHLSIMMEPPGPSAQQIETLLTVASRVPDHKKKVPWRFIVYSKETRQRLGKDLHTLLIGLGSPKDEPKKQVEIEKFQNSPLVIGVLSCPKTDCDVPVWEQELVSGAVCMNLLVAASGLGFAAQWLTGWFVHEDASAKALGANEGERFAGFIHMGQAASVPSERPRPNISSLVQYV